MTFELNSIEQSNLDKYIKRLKKKYKDYGSITYLFYPTAIGIVVKVRSTVDKTKVDITDYTCW